MNEVEIQEGSRFNWLLLLSSNGKAESLERTGPDRLPTPKSSKQASKQRKSGKHWALLLCDNSKVASSKQHHLLTTSPLHGSRSGRGKKRAKAKRSEKQKKKERNKQASRIIAKRRNKKDRIGTKTSAEAGGRITILIAAITILYIHNRAVDTLHIPSHRLSSPNVPLS